VRITSGSGGRLDVAGERLVGGLGDGEVGDRVVGLEQQVRLRGDRRGLRRVGGGQRVDAERVALRHVAPGQVADQGQAVDDVAGLELPDLVRFGAGRVRDLSGAQRERQPQRGDELVHLGLFVAVVQAALEPVAEQRAQRLALPHAVQNGQPDADPLGAQVHGKRPGVLRCRVGDKAGPQHRGGAGVAG
jgi:hypothetical protein